MSNDYINEQVDKIINKEKHSYPENIALASAWVLGNYKGTSLKIIKVKEKSSIADYFVLATASNPTQATSMAEEITVQLKKHDFKILSVEGTATAEWVLIDAGEIFVHIFQESARGSYGLDEVWAEAPLLSIPEHYYFSNPSEGNKEDGLKGYF